MEAAALVAEALLARRESAEVLCCLRHSFPVKAHHDPARGLAADLNVKVHLVRDERPGLCRDGCNQRGEDKRANHLGYVY